MEESKPPVRDTRLTAQKTMWPASESEFTDMICAAMCRAKLKYGAVKKDAKSNYGKYATLDAVFEAVDKANCEEGIAVSSRPIVIGDEEYLVTTLMHSSGQFLRAMSRIAANPQRPQEYLSYGTYFRRMHIAALCGVAAETDDDGVGATAAAKTDGMSAMRLEQLALQKLKGAKTAQERNEVVARVAMRVAKGEMTEPQLEKFKALAAQDAEEVADAA